MLFKKRMDNKLTTFGEEFLLNGVTPLKGFFQQLDTGRMHIYLDDTEVAMLTRPGLFLVTSSDAAMSPGDTLDRDGRTYSVLKTSLQKIAGTPVARFAVLA